MTVTDQDIRALTFLACRSRPHGARQWKESEVAAEIAKLHHRSLGDVILAVTRAAIDRSAERPSVITSLGSHWRDTRIEQAFVPQTMTSTERCSICGYSESACAIRHDKDDHEFESAAMAAKRRAEGDPEAAATAVAALKAGIEPMEVKPVKSLAEIEAERPGFAGRLAAIQAALPAPPLQEPEPDQPTPNDQEAS